MSGQVNPIPRSTLPPRFSSSPQRIARNSDSAARQWQKSKVDSRQNGANANALANIQRQIDRLRRRGGAAESAPAGMRHRGEWDASSTYSSQNVVTRGNLGEFRATQAVPVGTVPESGAPYWAVWTTSAPGFWA